LEKEDWDSSAWSITEFDHLFKKINAVDTRRLIFVVCFGTIPILADFLKAANVITIN